MAGGGVSGYVEVLSRPEAAAPFALSILARMSFSLAPLSMVLLVSAVRGSYSDAGLVTAAYGLGTAAGSPPLGRALDRFGQPRVVAPSAIGCGALLVALALTAAADAPEVVLLVLAALAGASFPPLGPAMRSSWRVVFPDDVRRRAGYALDAVAVETIFVAGPLLLSVLVVHTPAAVPLVVTGVLLTLGSLGYATTSAARRDQPSAPGNREEELGSPVRVPGMPALLLVVFGLSIAFGSIDTSIAATSREVLHDPASLGWLFTAIAGGSAIGGLVYGARAGHAPETEQRRLPLPLLSLSAALVPLALVLRAENPRLVVVLPILFVAGLSISPTIIMAQNLIDVLCPDQQASEGQAWMNTSITTGAALGAGLAGVVIDRVGVPGSFGNAAVATAVAAAVALGAQRVWRVRVGVLAAG